MAQGFLTGEPGTATESVGGFQDVLDLLEVQHKHTNTFLGEGFAPAIRYRERQESNVLKEDEGDTQERPCGVCPQAEGRVLAYRTTGTGQGGQFQLPEHTQEEPGLLQGRPWGKAVPGRAPAGPEGEWTAALWSRCSSLLALRRGKWGRVGWRGQGGGGLFCSLNCASIFPRAVLQRSEERTGPLPSSAAHCPCYPRERHTLSESRFSHL